MDLGLQVNKVSRLVEDYSMNGIRAYDLGQCTHDFYAMAIVYPSLPYNNSSYTVSVRLYSTQSLRGNSTHDHWPYETTLIQRI